jgi:hypothetical protein
MIAILVETIATFIHNNNNCLIITHIQFRKENITENYIRLFFYTLTRFKFQNIICNEIIMHK